MAVRATAARHFGVGALDERRGRAALVVQKHLGADSLQRWLKFEGFTVERVASKAGFRLLDVDPRN